MCILFKYEKSSVLSVYTFPVYPYVPKFFTTACLPANWPHAQRQHQWIGCRRKRTSVTRWAIVSCATFLFLPHFDVILNRLRRTATWNLFPKLNMKPSQLSNDSFMMTEYFQFTSLAVLRCCHLWCRWRPHRSWDMNSCNRFLRLAVLLVETLRSPSLYLHIFCFMSID